MLVSGFSCIFIRRITPQDAPLKPAPSAIIIQPLKKIKAAVLGVSIDSITSHGKFASKYKLPFTLLSDERKEVVKKYEVWAEKSMYGRKYMGTLRNSYLIDPQGKIAKIYEKVKPAEHAEQVLADLKQLRK